MELQLRFVVRFFLKQGTDPPGSNLSRKTATETEVTPTGKSALRGHDYLLLILCDSIRHDLEPIPTECVVARR